MTSAASPDALVGSIPRTIEWIDASAGARAHVRMVDQRLLPGRLAFLDAYDIQALVEAIRELAVRGAPALGVAGAMGVALWLCNERTDGSTFADLEAAAQRIATARPTAVNLAWGVEQVMGVLRSGGSLDAQAAVEKALDVAADDEGRCRAIGRFGAELLPRDAVVVTHCNAGSLATSYFGTALGIVYTAHEQGKIAHVYADETRPLGQGARLTMWELSQAGVPCTLQCDGMAASLMASRHVDAVIVGADRIAANGDTANKIGTFQLALAAHHFGVPLYVAAPTSTVDLSLADGRGIPIEFRGPDEVCRQEEFACNVYNPAFDVTPAQFVSAIVTEQGVFAPRDLAAGLAGAARTD